jgi:hypothetical protein
MPLDVLAPILALVGDLLLGKAYLVAKEREDAGIEVFSEIRVNVVVIPKVRAEFAEILNEAGKMNRRRGGDDGIVMIEH